MYWHLVFRYAYLFMPLFAAMCIALVVLATIIFYDWRQS